MIMRHYALNLKLEGNVYAKTGKSSHFKIKLILKV